MRLSEALLGSLATMFLLIADGTAVVQEDTIFTAAPTPRYLVYPPPLGAATKVQLIFGLGIPMEVDVSTIIGYVMKCNYNLPYNASYLTEPYVRRQRSLLQRNVEDNKARYTSGQTKFGRYEIYKILELAIDSSGGSGKACILRTICELAMTPLTGYSLFDQLLHTFLTPSSTMEHYDEPIDQEYLAAEVIGRNEASECARAFSECNINFLDYFSKLH